MLRGIKVSRSDERMFNRAREIALGSRYRVRVRVGALLTKGTRQIQEAINRPGPTDGEPFFPGHAERRAIDGVPETKGTLYVARIGLNGELLASWPCDECLIHITACSCVTKIVYYDGQALVKVRI